MVYALGCDHGGSHVQTILTWFKMQKGPYIDLPVGGEGGKGGLNLKKQPLRLIFDFFNAVFFTVPSLYGCPLVYEA